MNPWRYEFHYGLAAARAQRDDWPGAIPECQRALQLNPFRTEVRRLLVRCYLASGAKEQARTEFERLVALQPADADVLAALVCPTCQGVAGCAAENQNF